MTIDTLDFNSKPGEIIPIDDIDTKAIEPYILTKEESRLKENIWKFQNADYLARQKEIQKKKRESKHLGKCKQQQIISHVSQVSMSIPAEVDSLPAISSDEEMKNSVMSKRQRQQSELKVKKTQQNSLLL
jgi:hypothetical protein